MAGEGAVPDALEIEASAILQMLAPFPAEKEAVEGALSVYKSGGPDHGRQALGSLRNALENLVKRLSGETEWSLGLAKLIASETRRKTVRQVHSYLSAYGTHGPVQPSAGDTKSGFLLAFAGMRTLLESEKGT